MSNRGNGLSIRQIAKLHQRLCNAVKAIDGVASEIRQAYPNNRLTTRKASTCARRAYLALFRMRLRLEDLACEQHGDDVGMAVFAERSLRP